MLLDKTVLVHTKYRYEYYKKRGYACSTDKKVEVKIEDLPKESRYKFRVACDNCGKEYLILSCNYFRQIVYHPNKIYCCNCAPKVMHSGENHPNWNYNITDDERENRFRHIDGYKEFIETVLQLSDYKCKICGSHYNLQVHHLDGYEWCKEKRTDVNNGVCLCDSCHRTFHSKYGYKGNTKKQFEEWIGCEVNEYSQEQIDNVNLVRAKRVICLETNKIFESAYKCEIEMLSKRKNGTGSIVSQVCNRRGQTNNYHFLWYEDYLNLSEDEINEIKNKKPYAQPTLRKQVVCIETKQLFSSIFNTTKYLGVKSRSKLSEYLNGRGYKTFHKMHWCFLENYDGDINELEKVGDGW